MWIVRLALRRPYTFVVMALLIMAVSLVAVKRMSTDIFPEIKIPVVSVVWQYSGMPADEVYADVQGRDLGGVSADVQRVVASLRPELPRGSAFAFRGQFESMNSSCRGLAFGLLFAVP